MNILQFGRGRMEPWSTSAAGSGESADIAFEDIQLGAGDDVAVALAITHDLVDDVKQHITDACLPIGRMLAIRPKNGPGQGGVRNAAHALAIADEVTALIKKRSPDERKGCLHLFAASPNTLIFLLGQLSKSFGSVTLYEYDFEQTRGGGYEPSLTLPLPPAAA